MPIDSTKEFKPINISVLTISDTRTEATDKSGQILAKKLKKRVTGYLIGKLLKMTKMILKKFF